MSQMRLNQLTGRWVTIVPGRAQRPNAFLPRQQRIESDADRPCPFCPGNEESTPPALEEIGAEGSWTLRVIPNRYPAFEGDDGFAVRNLGPVFVQAEAAGIHEVLVYSPDHEDSLDVLGDDAVHHLVLALKDRFIQHSRMPNVRYTQAIVNHGREAGASLSHPHGQLLGLPFVPGEVLDEERAFARFAGGCLLCTTAEAELAVNERVVHADDEVLVVCPYWSGTPYELLIIPRAHDEHLQDATDSTLEAVGRALRDSLAKLRESVGDVAYNVGFHTAPHQHTGEYHWHVHVWPHVSTQAGFERGTGVMINVVAPEQAAATLRAVHAPA